MKTPKNKTIPAEWIRQKLITHLKGMLGCPHPGGAAEINKAIEWLANEGSLSASYDFDCERMKIEIAQARVIINQGVDLMTDSQVGRWEGCRGWLEFVESDLERNSNSQEPEGPPARNCSEKS